MSECKVTDIIGLILYTVIAISYFYFLYFAFKEDLFGMNTKMTKWLSKQWVRLARLGPRYHRCKLRHLKDDEVKYSKLVELNTQWFSSKEPDYALFLELVKEGKLVAETTAGMNVIFSYFKNDIESEKGYDYRIAFTQMSPLGKPVLHSSFKTNNWRGIFTGNKLNASEFLTRDIAIYFIDYIPYQR